MKVIWIGRYTNGANLASFATSNVVIAGVTVILILSLSQIRIGHAQPVGYVIINDALTYIHTFAYTNIKYEARVPCFVVTLMDYMIFALSLCIQELAIKYNQLQLQQQQQQQQHMVLSGSSAQNYNTTAYRAAN